MLEREIEKYLCKKVRSELGGRALKLVSPGQNGMPDRLVLLPEGRVFFVETKAPGKRLSRLQENTCAFIAKLGFSVLRIDTRLGVDAFVNEVKSNGI